MSCAWIISDSCLGCAIFVERPSTARLGLLAVDDGNKKIKAWRGKTMSSVVFCDTQHDKVRQSDMC